MYYYKETNRTNRKKTGGGIFDTLLGAVTSNVMKEVAKDVTKKTLTEVGNRASQKAVDKILPRKTRKGLNNKSLETLNKYLT